MSTILFTGFPGFLGSELLPLVLERQPEAEAVCVVQAKFAALAARRAEEIGRANPGIRGRVRVVEGDITLPDLGLADLGALLRDLREIFHLAAVYDLSVGRDLARRVNVEGTRNVLELAWRAPRLRRLEYVSTCYVSGRHPGLFREEDLACGQDFNNHYEETKFEAEVEVRRASREGLPVTVYRPSIVVGDSRTGATQKYDGPYFAIQWLLRQSRLAVMPTVGDPARYELNVVPRDFVVRAIDYLSARPPAVGETFQLADPHPLTIDELLDVLGRVMRKRILRVPLPLALAKGAIDHVPGVYPLLRIPSSAIDYFVHPTRYSTRNAQEALAGSGIRVPAFPEYAPRLIEFARRHPEIGAAAMA